MRLSFDANSCNGHRRNLHVFSQVNFRYDACLNILSLFEHDQSPFEATLDISEVEEVVRWYEVFCIAVGDQEVSRRARALANGENRLASLALNDGGVSRFFHALMKLVKIIRFIEDYHEFEREGFVLKDCVEYIQFLESLPSPPEHDLKTQKRRRQQIAGDTVKIDGRNILVKKLTVQELLREEAQRVGGSVGNSEVLPLTKKSKPQSKSEPTPKRRWISGG